MAIFPIGGTWIFDGNAGTQLVQTPIASVGGAVGSYLVIEAITTPPSTAITAGYGILWTVPSTDDLAYTTSAGTVQITGSGASGWQIGSNNLAIDSTFGSLNAFDVILQADSVEIARLVAATGILQIKDNFSFGGFPASVISGANDAGVLVLTGAIIGGMPSGASLLVGGHTVPDIPDGIASVASGHIFIPTDFSSPYGTISPEGFGIGTTSSFGTATSGVLSISKQTGANPTTSDPNSSLLMVGSDSNLYFVSSGFSYQLTPPGSGSSWNLSGNSVTLGQYFGSNNAQDVVYKVNSTESARFIESALGSFQLSANSTQPIIGTPTANLYGSLANGAITISGGNIGNEGAQLVLTGATNSFEANLAAVVGDTLGLVNGGNLIFSASAVGLRVGPSAQVGNATERVIAIREQSVNPTTFSASNGGLIYVGVDNNLFFLNHAGTFQLTPTGTSSWNLSGSNTGSGHSLGLSDTNTWSIVQNSVPFVTLATATLSIATNTSVTTLNVGNSSCAVSMSSTTFNLAAAGNVVLDTTVGSPLHNINIGFTHCSGTINMGNSASMVQIRGATGSAFNAGAGSALVLDDTISNLIGNGVLQVLSTNDLYLDVAGSGNLRIGDTSVTGNIVIGNSGAGQMDIQTHGALNIQVLGAAGGILSLGNGINTTSLNGNFLDLASPSSVNVGVNGATPNVSIGNNACTVSLNSSTTALKVNNVSYISLSAATLGLGTNAAVTSLTIGNTANPINLAYNGISAIGAGTINFQTSGDMNFVTTGTGKDLIFDVADGNISIGAHNNPASIVVGAGPSTVTTVQGNVTQMYGTTSMDVDSASITFGVISANTITIASGSCTTMIDGTIEFLALVSQTGAAAVPTHVQPAGFATLLINTTTKQISYYIQS